MTDLDQRDAEVLEALQEEFPISSTPFAIIGQMVDMSEKEVIKRVSRLRTSGALRAIQMKWDPRALGCSVALVIASVDEGDLEQAVDVIAGHPGISQCYQRNHEFNLWMTLCLPPDSALGLNGTVSAIASAAGARSAYALPAVRQYRDGQLEPEGETVSRAPEESDRRRIRILQDEIPIQPRPFDLFARQLNEPAEELLDFVRRERERGAITRIGPVLPSARSRFTSSAMGVWSVPSERVDDVGKLLSSDEAITSCTVRESQSDWPYNLFTIIQGRSVDECEGTMARLGKAAGVTDHQTLFPLHEYKQTRMALFPQNLEAWELEHAPHKNRTAAS